MIIVIPARYASTRLPGKPLLKQTGHYLIEHVYRNACRSELAQQVIVATDDQRIYAAVQEFGGQAQMTAAGHKSGTDRMAEVAGGSRGDIFVNVQGDEPEISPAAIDQVITTLQQNQQAEVATLVTPISWMEAQNPNLVKAVCDGNGYALYFSRAPIPYPRERQHQDGYFLGHIGIYAYCRQFLAHYPNLPQSRLEEIEKLEQLRVLENGYRIITAATDYRSCGIDTLEDYQSFVTRWQKRNQPDTA